MAKFVTETELNLAIENVIENAKELLIIVSPFIKLHSRIRSLLEEKKNIPTLEITILFGKNPDQKSKSLNDDDFNFLKGMPNIEIKYEKRLHAKYFANEKTQVLSTMNLYDYSQDKNIEAGIVTEYSYVKSMMHNLVMENKSIAHAEIEYFERVIKQSELVFESKPQFTNGILGLGKKYTGSISKENSESKVNEEIIQPNQINELFGFCIRTGVKIPFNINQPYSEIALESWLKFKKPDYKENFCHFSGEESNGMTSKNKPILTKHWAKAKKEMRF